jgi:hypothetical protein
VAQQAVSIDASGEASEAAGLRRFNIVVGLIHLAQAAAMLALSNDVSLPVTRSFLTGPPGTTPTQEAWFDVPLGPAMAAFLLLAALDHLLLAWQVFANVLVQ